MSEEPLESNTVCNTLDYRYTCTFDITKGVDIDADVYFDDNGIPAERGDTICYRIAWSFDNPNNDELTGAYLYDTIPEGTTYVTGAIPETNLSYSTNGGATWINEEPPAGSVGGTILRWGPIAAGWVGADDSQYFGTFPSQPLDINVSMNNSYSSD